MSTRIETAMSRAIGKVKVAKATLRGLNGVFRTLTEQHGEVAALMRRCLDTTDMTQRAELWQEVRLEILSHERAEKSEVYSAIGRLEDGEELVREHDADGKELEALIARVDSLEPGTRAWEKLFEELSDSVEHHATEEEDVIFPKALALLGDDRAQALDGRFLSAKEREADAL